MRRIGRSVVGIAQQTGGILVLLGKIVRRFFPPDIDYYELKRNLHKMGNRSLPIIGLTSVFVGAIMVVQASAYVQQFSATAFVGWGAGYVILRELGPILIALMFSGRVGANNTAELGTMVVTEQIDGLRSLAIDPISYLIVPRFLSMIGMLFILTVFGNLIALCGAALFGQLTLGIEWRVFFHGITELLKPWDVYVGLIKSLVFGLIIALSSCYFGLAVRGGAPGVGRAVNASVVASAVGIFVSDYFLTFLVD
ncbi:MAG: ABC transporter permease [Deltaproteobacteria bacterium]|nr:ABC transporter permease [Deltaproteobacteria bacterium]